MVSSNTSERNWRARDSEQLRGSGGVRDSEQGGYQLRGAGGVRPRDEAKKTCDFQVIVEGSGYLASENPFFIACTVGWSVEFFFDRTEQVK